MELNSQQDIAVNYENKHVLVLAGAGTGKTRTIIAKAAHLIQTGVSPRRILLLTFTRRAAKEMENRLCQIIGENKLGMIAGTFHHFCLLTMRRMTQDFGIENAVVIDRDDQIQLMKLIRGDYMKKGEPFPRAAELVSLCSYARNTNQDMRAYLEKHTEYDDVMVDKICRIAKDFSQRKKVNNYLDYDDILFRFAKCLREVPAIRNEIRKKFDHILVDEMQDTNPLQWLILDGLRDPAKLFCVGDDAQSIYAFRGADFKNVHLFTKRISDSVILRLEKNYRSTQGILDLSNWLLKTSPVKYDKYLKASRRTKSTPKILDFDSDFEEAQWITKDLITRHNDGDLWKDHMIITRTGYGARAVESYMVEKKIPYRFIGGISFLQAAHVKDLFSLIRASSNHRDELAWARYLTLWPRIGDITAARIIRELKKEMTILDALECLKKTLKGRKEITNGVEIVLDNWEDPSGTIKMVGGFLSPLLKRRYQHWEKRKQDFKLLFRLAKNHRSLLAFLETYTLDPISVTDAERQGQDDIVTLTTAHSAKGTEAPVCYLIRVEPGMYPHVRSLGNFDDEEEERRILYVGMTRAKDELIITRTYRTGGSFGLYSGSSFGNPRKESAYFLNRVNKKLVEQTADHFSTLDYDHYESITPWDRE